MDNKFDHEKKSKLFSEERKKNFPPKKILKKYGLKESMVMADIGCGNGYFSLPASEIVGDKGIVFAFDISPEMLKDLKEKTKQANIKNIQIAISNENKISAEDTSIDFAFLCNVLHEASQPAIFIKEIYRILKEKAKIVIIDWEKIQSDSGPPLKRRIDKYDVIETLKKNNFYSTKSESINKLSYIVSAKKKSCQK